MKLATPEFQTEYCTWARPLKTGMCLCRRLLAQFHECQSQCVCVRACECVCGLACFWELCNDKGWGECGKCFSFCLLVRSMCYLTLPLFAQQNAHTRAQGHPRRAQKAFSLQLIAALPSPVIKLFTALWPHSTRTHTDLCTHTHARARVCTCRIAAAQWWTAGVGPVKTLESASGHRHSVRSCFILSFLLPCPNSLWLPNTLVTNCQLPCGMVLWCTEPWILMPESANRLRPCPWRTDGAVSMNILLVTITFSSPIAQFCIKPRKTDDYVTNIDNWPRWW